MSDVEDLAKLYVKINEATERARGAFQDVNAERKLLKEDLNRLAKTKQEICDFLDEVDQKMVNIYKLVEGQFEIGIPEHVTVKIKNITGDYQKLLADMEKDSVERVMARIVEKVSDSLLAQLSKSNASSAVLEEFSQILAAFAVQEVREEAEKQGGWAKIMEVEYRRATTSEESPSEVPHLRWRH